MKKQMCIVTLLSAFTLPAAAQGLYVFADAERNKIESEVDDLSVSKSENGYGVGIGYRLNSTYAIELAYRDMLSLSEGGTYEDYGYRYDTDVSAYQASVIANYPLNNQVNIFGRLGIGRLDIDSSLYQNAWGDLTREQSNESETKALFGIGMGYSFTDHFGVRLEYSRFAKVEDVTLSSVSIGLIYQL
jgi:OOP family OmpA-OmpF porin